MCYRGVIDVLERCYICVREVLQLLYLYDVELCPGIQCGAVFLSAPPVWTGNNMSLVLCKEYQPTSGLVIGGINHTMAGKIYFLPYWLVRLEGRYAVTMYPNLLVCLIVLELVLTKFVLQCARLEIKLY